MNPKVSVIIPTYNRANLLPRAINSVLSQTFQDFELIVVDDASIDNTKEVVENFQKKDKRIRYIQRKNSGGGPTKAINAGLKVAQGEYISFLEDDDEWLPEKTEKQLELFRKSKKKNLGFVGCNVLIIDEKLKTTKTYNLPKYKDNVFLKKLLVGSKFFFNFSILIVKKEVVSEVGFLDENLKIAADQDIYLRIAQKYSFDFVPVPLIKFHIHGSNLSRKPNYNKEMSEWLYMLEKYRDLYKNNPMANSCKQRRLGVLCLSLGDYKQSRKYLLKSIITYPLNFKAYLNLLFCLNKKIYFFSKVLKKYIYKNP